MDSRLINSTDDDITIDIKKMIGTIKCNFKLLRKIFIVVAVFMFFVTLFSAKKYTVDAEILMNSTSSTNLSEFNPFVLSDSAENSISAQAAAPSTDTAEYIAILKSPLVMDKVIKENNLIYTKGKKKGEYISTDAFLRKNIEIEASNESPNIIKITYLSKDPEKAYKIVTSIIKNYKISNHEINMKKAGTDKTFLENLYAETYANVNKLISTARATVALPDASGVNVGALAAIKGYSRTASAVVAGASRQYEVNQRAQVSLTTEVEKLKEIKNRLEWIKSVERLSEASSNIVVLKEPVLKKSFEYSSPSKKINAALTIFFTVFLFFVALFWDFFFGKKVSYYTLGENIIYGLNNIDELKVLLITNTAKAFGVIIFSDNSELMKELSDYKNIIFIKPTLSEEMVNSINSCQEIILVADICKTSRNKYLNTKNMISELNKPICAEIAL